MRPPSNTRDLAITGSLIAALFLAATVSLQLQPPRAAARAAAQEDVQRSISTGVRVYNRNQASVVNITTLAEVDTRLGRVQLPVGSGSGFILDAQGRIVTNDHVIDGAEQIIVTFPDRSTVPAAVLGHDPDNDLAVLQVDPNGTDEEAKPIRDRLQPVALGDSDRIAIGEDVIAIGSPLGLQQTVTGGIVSAVRHPGEATTRGESELLGGAIQTDAAINPGNSGGPLFNAAGEVIGVNTAIVSRSGGSDGIGFAIPINVVRRVVPELVETGRYRHPLLGVSTLALSRLTPSMRELLGLPPTRRGLLVQEVRAGAESAGVRAGDGVVSLGSLQVRAGGDVIVSADRLPLTTEGELRGYVENHKRPGDTVTLTILRGSERLDVLVTLGEQSPRPGGRREA